MKILKIFIWIFKIFFPFSVWLFNSFPTFPLLKVKLFSLEMKKRPLRAALESPELAI